VTFTFHVASDHLRGLSAKTLVDTIPISMIAKGNENSRITAQSLLKKPPGLNHDPEATAGGSSKSKSQKTDI